MEWKFYKMLWPHWIEGRTENISSFNYLGSKFMKLVMKLAVKQNLFSMNKDYFDKHAMQDRFPYTEILHLVSSALWSWNIVTESLLEAPTSLRSGLWDHENVFF